MTIGEAFDAFFKEIDTPIPQRLEVMNMVMSGASRMLVEDDAHGVTGFIVWSRDGVGQGFWVRPDKRNSRLAHRLFTNARQQAKLEGINKVTIWVAKQRESIYRKRGFSRTYAVMEKTL